jgi:hypothetical protein
MATTDMWDSLERMDRLFRRARGTALVCGAFALATWAIWIPYVAVPFSVAASTAILIGMFAWFRKEDLRQRQDAPRKSV